MTYLNPEEATRRDKILAWGVHIYTASGALWGVLAILALMEHNVRLAFVWMGVTVFIDAVDGSLARRFRVKDVVPRIDGALLDNMVDYFTYVIVPAVLVYQSAVVPSSVMTLTIALITLSSAYQFSQTDAKTDDHYFKGFPSYWNLVVVYLILLDLNPWINFALLALCAVLVFVPIKYIYPSRTRAYFRLTLVLNMIWACAFIAMVALYPNTPRWLTNVSLFYLVYYTGLSLYLTYKTR